ncbi:hypothetical protein CTA2_3316 [Colletotrichum tanaceti]|nr:hypothetical protein CTA2_3316 [Colletotrichum tanaceti]
MDHPLEQQKDVDAVTQEVSSEPSTKRFSKVESLTSRLSAGLPVNSAEGKSGRFVRSALKASWSTTVSRMLSKRQRTAATSDTNPAPEFDVNGRKSDASDGREDKRLERLSNRSNPTQPPRQKPATLIDVAASGNKKNKGLLKRRSLGDFFGSISSHKTLKKRCRSPETPTDTVGSSLSTESPAKSHDHAASDNAPPTLPKLPPSGDLATSFQRNLEADSEAVASGLLTSQRTDATREGSSVPEVPGMIDLYTGRQLVWNTVTSADPRSVQTQTPRGKREETIQEEAPMFLQALDKKRKDLGLRPCTNSGTAYTTVDPLQAVYESKLIRGPRLEYKRKTRRSLGEDEGFVYSSGSVWRKKDEASNGATAAGDDVNVSTAADDDITDLSSNLGGKNLKKKAKSLTFIRQLEAA